MLSVNRTSDVLVLNSRVTATKLTLCFSNTLSIRVKSSSARLRRSTLYTTTQSSSPASTAPSSLARAAGQSHKPLETKIMRTPPFIVM
jgi:hypothetical protein